MIEISPSWIAILMLGGLVLGVLTGFPLAFPIGTVALVMGYLAFGGAVFPIIYQQVFSILHSYVFLALPLFIIMGIVFEYSLIADKMYEALYLWLSGLKGGLAIVTLVLGTILAACVGVVSASVTVLTSLALPAMLKRGYDKSLACGTICAGGALGILIPPSVMLVIYGPMARISVGRLFMGAMFPGLLLVVLYMMYVAVSCLFNPQLAPTIPKSDRQVPLSRKVKLLIVSLVPPAFIILAVLGTIYMGIAPPTEAAAVGAFASIVLTVVYRRMSWKVMKAIALRSLNVSCMAMLIGAVSVAFTGVFLRAGAGKIVQDAVLGMPGGRWGVFGVVMFVYFFLGFFMEWIGIFFIMVPILAPLAPALNFDPIWFGIMICVNLQMSFLTPPYAFAIFVLQAVAPKELGITSSDVIRGVVPYVFLIIVGIALCIAFPEIILWLPNTMIG